MKIETVGGTVRISELAELTAVNSGSFREEVRAALPENVELVEIDLSRTRFLDHSGLGALFALYRATSGAKQHPILRLLNPTSEIRQLLELTQMKGLFEITSP